MQFFQWEAGVQFFQKKNFKRIVLSMIGLLIPALTQAETLTLNCSRLVRTDTITDSSGKLVPKMQLATPYNDSITLVDQITVDLSAIKLTVLEPGSINPIDYGTPQINDRLIFGRIVSFVVAAGIVENEPAKTMKIVYIDRITGAFSTSEILTDHYGVNMYAYHQAVGTCTKGAKQF